AAVMRIFGDWINHAGRDAVVAGIITMKTFALAPAIVSAARDDINLLVFILPYVAQKQRAIDAVEAETERIAYTIGPNFLSRASCIVKWIVGRNAVLQTRIGRAAHVDS